MSVMFTIVPKFFVNQLLTGYLNIVIFFYFEEWLIMLYSSISIIIRMFSNKKNNYVGSLSTFKRYMVGDSMDSTDSTIQRNVSQES